MRSWRPFCCGLEFGEGAAVLVFLFRHLDEDLGRSRVGLHQRMGETGIGAGIVVLAGDDQCQDFLFGQVGKALHVTEARSVKLV